MLLTASTGNIIFIEISIECSLFCRAREALRQCLPDQLRDTTFSQCLVEDTTTKHFLLQLLKNLETPAGNSVNAL